MNLLAGETNTATIQLDGVCECKYESNCEYQVDMFKESDRQIAKDLKIKKLEIERWAGLEIK
jgi:hypothetical protein